MSPKIIKIKNDTDFYMRRAKVKLDQGDYPAVLSYLTRAQKQAPGDMKIKFEIALTYVDMGLYESALKVLIKLLAMGKEDAETYKEIIKCYFEMEFYDQAFYYYKEALDIGAFDDTDIEDFVVYEDEEFNNIQMRDKKDSADLLQLSHKLMLSGDFGFAKQLMETISPESYQFIDASNSLAVIALSSGKAEEAIEHSAKVLEADEENVYALSHTVMAYNMLNKDKEKEQYLSILAGLEISRPNELAKAALCMQQIGNNELAKGYLEKIILQNPYSKDYLITCAIANSNSGDRRRAKELIVRAYNIYPGDITIKYYADIINQSDEPGDIPILPTVPQETARQWVRDIDSWRKGASKKSMKSSELEKAGLYDKILWVFQAGDWKLQGSLGTLLMQSAEWESYIRDLLIDPYFDFRAKKECLLALLKQSKNKDFDLFITEMFLNFTPKLPKGKFTEEMEEAYWQVYSTLSFICSDFDLKLNKSFKQLVRYYNDDQFIKFKIDVNVFSALLLHRINMKHIFKDKIDCCEIFNCDLTDFNVYNDIFGAVSDEYSHKKSSF